MIPRTASFMLLRSRGESGTVRATGERFRNEWCQKYAANANQITRMVEYNIQVEPR